MLRSLDEATVELLRERIGVETDAARARSEIDTGLALAALDGADPQARLAAIATLREPACSPDVRNRLAALRREVADGSFVETDEQVRRGRGDAVRAHRSIAQRSIPASRRCSSA